VATKSVRTHRSLRAEVFAAHAMRLVALWRGLGALFTITKERDRIPARRRILAVDFPDFVVLLGIAVVAAQQNSSFTSVVNLRRFAEGLFAGTISRWDSASLRLARAIGPRLPHLSGWCASRQRRYHTLAQSRAADLLCNTQDGIGIVPAGGPGRPTEAGTSGCRTSFSAIFSANGLSLARRLSSHC